MKLRIPAILLSVALALAVAWPVFAHATLLRSIPEANAALPRSPAQVELFFSEAIEPSFSAITVIDTTGAQVDNVDSRVDPSDSTHLTISLRSLPDGIYTASWQVLSAVDGHVTAGAFPFAVGDVDLNELASAGQAARIIRLSLTEVLARWLNYLSASALTGGALFVLVVWRPAFRAVKATRTMPGFVAPWGRLASLALIILIIGNVIALLTQAGQASSVDIAAPWSNATSTVLFNTRYGVIWIARLALAFLIAAFLPHANSARDRWIAFGAGGLLLLTISLGSHAAAQPDPLLPVIADWIHLLAAAVWVGGLTHFVAAMWAARQFEPPVRVQLTARLIPRFSALALLSVGVLSLTGLYAALLHVGSFDLLNNTIYGRTLIIKMIILMPMLALGAVNLLGITPNMKKAAADSKSFPNPSGLVARFRDIVTSEITLGVVLFLSVGLLTSIPPAQNTATAPAITGSATVDDLAIDLDITPGRVGLNTFTLALTSGGQPVFNTQEVLLRFTPASGKLPPSEISLSAQGGGKYGAKGSNLSLPDNWQVQAIVRREGMFDAYANFDVSAGTSTTQSYPWHRVAGGMLLGGALAYLYAFSNLGQTTKQLIGLGIVPALAMAVVSVIVFYSPPSNEQAELLNPIPPNPGSIAQGQILYQTNCVPCHGETGKGDGPVGVTLSPRPSDLTLHTVPGVHPDGQLYLWISDGFPGSVMPKFRTALSDEERWHLVNYIRTLSNQ